MKLSFRVLAFVLAFSFLGNMGKVEKPQDLYAISACLMDAETGRVLFGKNENEIRAMASTTKIMTLVIALEYGSAEDVVMISSYAASMPDVQLNVAKGEEYRLGDLEYAMMLESFNDVAAAIAEHIGAKYCGITTEAGERTVEESKACVAAFAGLMNEKAKELGCTATYFITPNGLDGEDENGKHSSTAKEMALIGAYAVKNDAFNEITNTAAYHFTEINGRRSCQANNKDAFLYQMEGAFGIKTGFTGDAGYCFVGALESDGRVFISVVLGCGWPGNKTYKWKDTRKLMEYGKNNFFRKKIFSTVEEYKNVAVIDGIEDLTGSRIDGEVELLLSEDEEVKVVYELEDYVNAPVYAGDILGKVVIYIDDVRYITFPITATDTVPKTDFSWHLAKFLNMFLLNQGKN